jgi:hypothetical protein
MANREIGVPRGGTVTQDQYSGSHHWGDINFLLGDISEKNLPRQEFLPELGNSV